ncbi:aldo/keto reductase [Hahella sp. CCB-MM4]|uniref:aldo/keto reductase n=1 Tax=Hahella sp. (strain CCB-MM4) TaxID=1926491 RepID=UPI000B9B8B35|nr:aldo/keto reductase [Hahella sp. CCB-MM4]OZG70397.1 aldo/keto reductase [Hahella sp. CCB-MM4]
MKTRVLGSTDINASVIGLGTWAMGGWMWGGTDEQQSIEAIRESIKQGVSLIDTAPAYGLGRSEKLVGEAIKGQREKVILATKCGLVWHTNEGGYFFNEEGKDVHRFLGAESIRYELDQSLERLQTDYIDLYITHWQDPSTPIEETMSTLLELKREGKIRAIGISNATIDELKEYQKFGPVDAVQERYNMIDRALEAEILPHTIDTKVSCLSYSSLALGLLSGKITSNTLFSGDDQRLTDPLFSPENLQIVQEFCQEVAPLANDLDISIAQLVIAWTLAQPGVTYALCGARNARQASENARAGNLKLNDEILDLISMSVSRHINRISTNS